MRSKQTCKRIYQVRFQKRNLNFHYLTNMLKIKSRDLTVHNTGMLIKFSKQIANNLVTITKGPRFLEVITRGEFKTLSNI